MPRNPDDTRVHVPLTPAVFHILFSLADGELHGYAIMRAVEEDTSPAVKMGPGTIYGSLQRMVDAGLVEERGVAVDGKRRLYGMTEKGREALEAESARLANLARMVREKGLVPREA